MELNITFGWHLDGPSYPEESAIGRLAVGPIGMLSQLCLRLGLTARFPAQAVRIAEYMSLLRDLDDGLQFYSQSFQTDSWGTAKALLFLRDDLVGSGWNLKLDDAECEHAPPRLATFVKAERLAGTKLLCLTDMISPILERLGSVDSVSIDSVTLVDEEELLPPVWRKLFAVLKKKNVAIEQWRGAGSSNGADESDVEKLAAFLNANIRKELSGDGTLVILESDDEVQAADCVSNLLKSMSTEGESTVLIRGSSTSFLDQLLKKRNLPSLGGADKSPLRGYMQILPLTLELLWKPFDPMRMVEFLMVPYGPIPRSVSRRFVNTLKVQPGIGGSAWHEAWSESRADSLKRMRSAKNKGTTGEVHEQDVLTEAEAARLDSHTGEEKASEAPLLKSPDANAVLNTGAASTELRNGTASSDASTVDGNFEEELNQQERYLKEWLEPIQFDGQEGIPASVVISVCERVKRHAHVRLNTLTDKLTPVQLQVFLKTAVCAETLAVSVQASRMEKVSRSQLLRMMESAMGDGYSPDNPHASLWTPVDHPGQIIGPADTVIWWGFIDTQKHGFTNPWSREEIAFLETKDVLLESPQESVVREAKSWCRPLSASVKSLLLVKPRTVAGRTVAAHPFYHEVASAMKATPHHVRERCIKQAHLIYAQPESDLLRLRMVSQKLDRLDLPRPRPIWKIAERIVNARVESATSLERLLGCPMSWLLKYKAKLKYGNLLSIASGDQLAGNLVHAVFAAVFSDENGILTETSGDDGEQRANRIFDELCPKIAAPLLLPGNSLERQRLKKAISDAVVKFYTLIKEAGFSKITCEAKKDATIDEVVLTGRPDIVLAHPDNFDFVVDLKWTRRAPYRRREINEGRAIQLALYASLAKNESNLPTSGGYFMVSQKQLFSTAKDPFPEHAYVDGPSLEQTFKNLIANYKHHMVTLNEGTVHATGMATNIPLLDEVDDGGINIVIDEDPELIASKIPGITLALEPPCRICDFGRLCGKKELD